MIKDNKPTTVCMGPNTYLCDTCDPYPYSCPWGIK